MPLRYFQYLSKSKVELLHQQMCLNKPGIAELSPKVSLGGLEVEFGIKKDGDTAENIFRKTSELISVLNKQKLIKPIVENTDLTTTDFYHSQGVWHQGILTWNLYIGTTPDSNKRDIEAYCLYKVINNSIVLLVGSASHLIGYNDGVAKTFDEPISTSSLLYVKLYRGMFQYVQMEEKINKLRSKPFFGNKILEAAFSIELGAFCENVVSNLPEKSIDTVFKIYSQYDIRRNVARLAQHDSQERVRIEKEVREYKEKKAERKALLEMWQDLDEKTKHEIDDEDLLGGAGFMLNTGHFVRMASQHNLFQYRYLNIGSPLYTAI